VPDAETPPTPDLCPGCGFPIGSFACKIRHISMNSGVCKASIR
jgi:hypothetical protein